MASVCVRPFASVYFRVFLQRFPFIPLAVAPGAPALIELSHFRE